MKFTIYSKDNCPYCLKIKKIFELIKLDFVVYSLDKEFTREEFYSEFGKNSTFPQVVVNDQCIGGCTDTIKYLKENNLL